MTHTSRRHRAVAVACASLLCLTTAACSPITTTKAYEASDGVNVTIAPGLRGLNLIILSSGENREGALIGAFDNETDSRVAVTVKPESGKAIRLTVDAGEVLTLPNGKPHQVGRIKAAPGDTIRVAISAGVPSAVVSVPVLDGTFSEYAGHVPGSKSKK